MKNIAVLLAAGEGRRFSTDQPKQFAYLHSKMLIEYTLDVFQEHDQIDEIIIAVQPRYIPLMQELQDEGRYSKIKAVVEGGRERYHSSLAILDYLQSEEDCHVLIHDAVRPFITGSVISDVIRALDDYKAVVVAVPSTDTVLEVEGRIIRKIPDRSLVWNAQTPQAFHLNTIRKAFGLAVQDPQFAVTDDSNVVFSYLPEEPIHVIKGDPSNIKITYSHDLSHFFGNR